MEDRIEELAVRAVEAIERLAADPIVEIEAGPPVCPACGRFNPEITVRERNSSGPIFGFILEAVCNSCGVKFYAVPETWHMYLRREELALEMQERAEINNAN
jgi:hypothetical protein